MPSDELIGSGRPMRTCSGLGVGCGQTDDHPRHVIDDGSEDEIGYHLDCHASMGCTSCKAQVDGFDGATGQAMLDHVLAIHADSQEA